MRRRTILIGILMATTLVLVAPTALAGGAVRGSAEDPNYCQSGEIEYLGTPAGYHFWFTPVADYAVYEEGHSYHNVYQYSVDNPGEWCGPVNIPDRPPYNLAADPSKTAYYKIFDTTTDTQICP